MSKTTILIVEDEAIVAADLAGKLRRLGYDVAGTAAKGEDAIALAENLGPDLVLMDIRLEGTMDGIQATEEIRRRIDVPVIYLTAHSDAATLSQAKLTGPFGYILKPFEERELATQIELALYKHQADREIRRQREWLRVTLSSIGDAVIATDGDGRVAFLNPVAESLTGWKAEEAMGLPLQTVFRIVNERTGKSMEGPVSRVLSEGCVVPLANHAAVVTRDGRIVPIEDTAAPILDSAGGVVGAVLVFHDVTRKRRGEEALRESEERFRVMANSIPQLAWIAKADGYIYWYNRQWYEYTGTTPAQMEGWGWQSVHHPDELPVVLEGWKKSIATGEPFEMVFPLRGAGGNFRQFLTRGVPVRNAEGELIQWCGTNTDITERKLMEDELRRSRDELELRVEERTAELTNYMEKLEQSNGALREFASIASHDLQEPLRKVRAFGDRLIDRYASSLDEPGKDYLNRMLNAVERMQNLIDALLNYSRVTTKIEPFSDVELSKVMAEVLSDLETLIERTGGRVEAEDLPTIRADASQMRQLMQNLIGNGLKYHGGEKPLVKVAVENLDSAYMISVQDNGIGFNEKYLPKIFQPFQRLHGKTSQYEGTGMGLAICRKIVERHGGSITATSEPGKGSMFIVRLPVNPDQAGIN